MIESWIATQSMLDHWAFLAREGQKDNCRTRTVLDAEPVLDLLEDLIAEDASDAQVDRAIPARKLRDELLRTHGRLSS